ncbi:MAG: AMP-binding protein [Marinilabiliaceae bacterium]|nr:AMP-binding protein [Marinilabiliaceae bacterium]
MKTIIDFFYDSVSQYPNNPFIWEKTIEKYEPFTYCEIKQEVELFANALLALNIKENARVALLSEGRKHWLISELAILSIGAINVPLSTKLEADSDLSFRINHSGAETIIVSGNQLEKIRLISKSINSVSSIIVFDETDSNLPNEIKLSNFLEAGLQHAQKHPNELNHRIAQLKPDSIANISYTSGTTADPKGIILSHRNYTSNVEQAFSFIDIPQEYKTLVVLPWDHAFAHTAALYSFMHKGASIASVQIGKNQIETLKNFSNNMLEIKPDVLMSVPALAKNFKKNIEKGIRSKGKMAATLFNVGLQFAYWYNGDGNNKGKTGKKITYPIYALFNILIFKKIKERFGGNLKYFIGGGALLDIDLQRFFYAIGIPMYQGYGLSEAAPIISANTPDHHKMGSSGRIVDRLDMKICDENGMELPYYEKGEIVIKGENVMLGYWQNDKATQETIKNNWLHTGDLGYLDKDNYLYVLGRYKSLLIGADGEKYSPEGIEEAVTDYCQFIDQFMLYNNQNPFTVGLIVLNREKINTWKKQNKKNFHDESSLHELIQHIKLEIDQFKSDEKHKLQFPQRWLPATNIILPDSFNEKNKLINSTMKIVRSKVESFYKEEINYLYTLEGKNILSNRNLKNLKRFLNIENE